MRGRGLGRALVLAVVPFGLAALPLAGQAVPMVTDRVDVRLVEVDAWAHDGSRPVLDLTAEELRLYEDGKRVEILFFTPPTPAETAPRHPRRRSRCPRCRTGAPRRRRATTW
jgi:hypothetical protein